MIARRQFITLFGSAATWPLAARAQQAEPVRRIGVLANFAENDADTQAMIGVLQQRLSELGWNVSRNLQIEARWSGGDPGRLPARAAELLALKPDVLIGTNTPAVAALRQVTEAVPIVFVNANDPIRLGFVQSLARPGGNITGFISWGSTIGGKWLELLTEIVPGLEHVALTFNPRTYTGQQTQSIEAAAPALRVGLTSVAFRDGSEIERALAEFSQTANRGLLVLPDSSTVLHRDLIVGLAARHRIPAIYPFRAFITSGGLAYYGTNTAQQYRSAAEYVDRILKGAKPADLPVQAPTRYELVINLNTAKTLGLTVPDSVLARADEVIE
jgi:putative tryptophan/tyrosine transport system substrate-binding protein